MDHRVQEEDPRIARAYGRPPRRCDRSSGQPAGSFPERVGRGNLRRSPGRTTSRRCGPRRRLPRRCGREMGAGRAHPPRQDASRESPHGDRRRERWRAGAVTAADQGGSRITNRHRRAELAVDQPVRRGGRHPPLAHVVDQRTREPHGTGARDIRSTHEVSGEEAAPSIRLRAAEQARLTGNGRSSVAIGRSSARISECRGDQTAVRSRLSAIARRIDCRARRRSPQAS